jgi:hypothetical protein
MAKLAKIDPKEFLQSVKKTFREIERMTPKKLSMGFDFEGLKKWKTGNIEAYKAAHSGLEKSQKQVKDILNTTKMIGKAGGQVGKDLQEGLKRAKEESEKHLKVMRDIEASAKNANRFQRLGAEFAYKASKGGRFSGVESRMGTAFEAVGGLANMTGGPWGKFAMMAGGAAISAYQGASMLAAPRRALAGQNLDMMGLAGRRISDQELAAMRGAGVGYGFMPEETMSSAIGLQRQAGNVSASALTRFSKLRRQTGLGSEELTGIASALRGGAISKEGVGLEQNLDKAGKMYAEAVKAGLDKSGALRYLSTMTGILEENAENGDLNQSTLSKIALSLTEGSEYFKANPSRALMVAQGADASFQNSANAGLAMRTMRSLETQGGPMELLLKQKMGLFGKGFSLGGQEFGSIKAGGLSQYVKEIAKASGVDMSKGLQGQSRERLSTATLGVAGQLGIKPMMAAKLMEATQKGPISDKLLQEIQDSTLDSTDLLIKKNEAGFQNVVMTLGDSIAPKLANIEGYVAGIAQKMLGITPKKTAEEYRQAGDRLNAGKAAIMSGKSLQPMETDAMVRDFERRSQSARSGFNLRDFPSQMGSIQTELTSNLSQAKEALAAKQAENTAKGLPERTDTGGLQVFISQLTTLLNQNTEAIARAQQKNQYRPQTHSNN